MWVEAECVIFVMAVRVNFKNANSGAAMDGLPQLSGLQPNTLQTLPQNFTQKAMSLQSDSNSIRTRATSSEYSSSTISGMPTPRTAPSPAMYYSIVRYTKQLAFCLKLCGNEPSAVKRQLVGGGKSTGLLVPRSGHAGRGSQLKDEFRTYEALRREHDAQIMQIATEVRLRIAADHWSALLYGD
ncbi:uncharacterized protein [Battus philenor]|uniref:uncharacterized protein n=1 Tax=Battus philenor TaxID=42288 RepID=UPI0035D0A24F